MYKLKFHKDLNPEKWSKFTPTQQILMIGNELNRARNWLIKDDTKEVNNCYERAFELLDLTIAMNYRKNLVKELLRAREVLAILYLGKKKNIKLNNLLFDVLLSLKSQVARIPASAGTVP
mgnify:CR=1 FL=1